MTPLSTSRTSELQLVPLTAAQQRIVDAARELFGEHGVSGTSLQMIADAVGVTKAAVYHQYNAKEEIVFAAATSELVVLEQVVNDTEAQDDKSWAREVLLEQVVDIVVARRSRAAILQGDPVMVRLLATHEPYRQLMERMYRLLTGDAGPGARVQAAMLTASLGAAVAHPLVIDMDDDELRGHLLYFARRLLF